MAKGGKKATQRAIAQSEGAAMPLSALEMHAIADYFNAAGMTYADHSCNDYDLPDTPVRREIVDAANARMECDPDDETLQLNV